MRIFVQKFGREVFGTRPVTDFINRTPLLVESNEDIEKASRIIREKIQHPITEDFVIVENGEYRGMGVVLSLLELMEQRASQRTRSLVTANHQLKASQTQLVQSEKMASLGQMVAGIAHEMNTPLGYVSSNLELISDFSKQIQDSQAAAAEVQNAALFKDMDSLLNDSVYGLRQMGELITGLRSFSRLDQSRQDEVSLNECIDSALTIARNVVRPKAEVIKNYDSDTLLRCVPSQINQVLLNLLTNAAQAIDHFGEITITTKGSEDYVDVYIRDTGKGMPEDVRSRIFDPFYTTKPVGEGTGLGLSISWQIIRQHRGIIKVRSVEGKGTVFVIRLPRHQANEQPEETAA
ncbi:ATPase [Cellvibrio sp. KB43]|uniref:histidine kinase n=2 Tax=Cellvibrio polysaccharolyticus TaxID=2082724 RepID=A0A928YT61_9GAMM|nr:ATPase [Cellvibrio polysaccharolyticus]